MELMKEILSKALEEREVHIWFGDLTMDVEKIVDAVCYSALKEIKTIIETDGLSDFECVERIVCVFENIGSNCGGRHDFG